MSLLDNLLGVMAPHDCLRCGREGGLLCDFCSMELPLPPGRCYRCRQQGGSALCATCRPRSPLDEVIVATAYEELAKELVWQLKYNGAQAASRLMARQIRPKMRLDHELVTLVPVPTAASRVRQRGYDQAVLLSRELSRSTGLSYARLLRRQGHAHQVGASRDQRLEQLQTAFSAKTAARLTGAHILLVDDVLTTGATMEAAARALRLAGARSVGAAVFAQTA